jgi:hypothetical protein
VFKDNGMIFSPNYVYLIITYAMNALMVYLLPYDYNRVSTYALQIMLVINIIPHLSFCWLSNSSIAFSLFYSFCFIVICILLQLLKPVRFPGIKVVKGYSRIKAVHVIFIICVLGTISIIFKNGIPRLNVFDFNNVYQIRSQIEYSRLWGYLLSWLQRVFIPCLMLISLEKRKYVPAAVAILEQIILYVFTAQKTILLSIYEAGLRNQCITK